MQRASTASGAPFVSTHTSPSRASSVDISLSVGSKRNSRFRARVRSSPLSGAPSRAEAAIKASSVGSPNASPPLSREALLQAAIATASSRTVAPGSRSPPRVSPPGSPAPPLPPPGRTTAGRGSISISSTGVHTETARMRFSVSVPVLSVQITSVEPSVSTALKRLTTAPWCTSPRTPTASASVMTGSSPSGTLPTSSPTANTTASLKGRPAPSMASGMKAIPSSTAISAISHATRLTCCSSGLSSAVTRSESAAMRPISVCMPVANTSARASPSVQAVPLRRARAPAAKARLCRAGRRSAAPEPTRP